MNIFLPSLPSIAEGLDTPYSVAQLILSLFLAATAVVQLIVGPFSDRYGRRVTVLWCYAAFIVGSLICVFATTIEVLLVGRVTQAFAAGGFVLSRAIIRDTHDRERSASIIGYVTMAMTIVPMFGPVLGGYLQVTFGWQSSFVALLVVSACMFALVWFDLGETNHNPSDSLKRQFKHYGELIHEKTLWCYIAVASFGSGMFFAFLGGAPFVGEKLFGLRPTEIGYYFTLIGFGYMVGNFLSGRYSVRFGVENLMLTGSIAGLIGAVISLLLFTLGVFHPFSFFMPMFLIGIGNGLTLPNAMAGAISVRPDVAGSASGLMGFCQVTGGAILSWVASNYLSVETGIYPLLGIMGLTAAISVLFAIIVLQLSRTISADTASEHR